MIGHISHLGSQYSGTECRTAARAILRHLNHLDGDHLTVRKPGGLHPLYLSLRERSQSLKGEHYDVQKVLDESLRDVFDSVCPNYFLIHYD
jgi:hypothetical protein